MDSLAVLPSNHLMHHNCITNYGSCGDYGKGFEIVCSKIIDFLLNKKYNKDVLIVKQKVGVIDGSKDGKAHI